MKWTAALAALALGGCWANDTRTPDPHVTLPGVPPLIVVAVDSVSVVPLGPIHDGDYEVDWTCSAPQANLTIAGISGGSIRIEITDDAGVLVHDNVYNGGLVGAITGMTSPDGEPGEWTVRFTFDHVLSIGAIEIDADVFDEPDGVVIGGAYALESAYEFEAGWPAGPAQVTLASAISLGVVRVRLWDGEGTLVMDRTNLAVFVGAFNGDSHSGAAGTWKIRIDIDAVATAGAITIDHP